MQDTADTRERLLDASEQLFATHGYTATSVRAITEAAGANLGAVNYHFGSKENLLTEVVRRRIVPVDRKRLALLEACEAGGGADLETILRAFVEPILLLGSEPFPRLLGRLYSEPLDSILELFRQEVAPVILRFQAALERVLPEVPAGERHWALEFTVASVLHTLMVGDRLEAMTDGLCDATDSASLVDRVVRYAAAGLRAADVASERRSR